MVGQDAIQFQTLASKLAWSNEALIATFWEGLSGHVKDELASQDLPATLDGLITQAIHIEIQFAKSL